jgi:MFS family permease
MFIIPSLPFFGFLLACEQLGIAAAFSLQGAAINLHSAKEVPRQSDGPSDYVNFKVSSGATDSIPHFQPYGRELYDTAFGPLMVITIVLALLARPKVQERMPAEFRAHAGRFLPIWCLAVSADWLQGPYVYELYQTYGYSPEDIGRLFVVGFMSSMIFGTMAGTLVDYFGRKRGVILYCLLYILADCTKHVNNYYVLLLGRMLAGTATSLLISLECWMVAEHGQRRDFSQGLLHFMFGTMYFISYMSAIISGFAAQISADAVPLRQVGTILSSNIYVGGCTAPFDLASLMLLVCALFVALTWSENYGAARTVKEGTTSCYSALVKVCQEAVSCPRTACLLVIVPAFEGSMYAFVFDWSPTLDFGWAEGQLPPHGLIFALFMMAATCGQSIYSLTVSRCSSPVVLLPALCFATLAFAITATFCEDIRYVPQVFAAFLLFEVCVGMYYPAMGALKSQIVREDMRAGVYNLFRAPMNLIVCGLLLSDLTLKMTFVCGCVLLFAATICLRHLYTLGGGERDPLIAALSAASGTSKLQ